MASSKSPQFVAYSAIRAASRATSHARVALASRDAAAEAISTLDAWEAVSSDCRWLEAQSDQKLAAFHLNALALWQIDQPKAWQSKWRKAVQRLVEIYPHYKVWVNWYKLRLSGAKNAFYVASDSSDVGNEKILSRLAQASDLEFWGKGSTYVNTTLQEWIDEARANAAKLESPPKLLGAINPDPQDTRSPQFGLDPTGRIAIKGDVGADQLRSDPQSLSRHARALLMAQKLGEALRSHNNAGYVTEMVGGYVAAMGDGQDDPDPSGLVFAGDQLREAIANHRAAAPDDDLQPLPPSADRDASAFLSAHNMYVGSDPFLDDLDRTTRGPDAPLPSANPDEIRRVANTAREDDILAEQTHDYLIAASEAAPATYDPADRHSRFAAGVAQNFARYGIEFLWAYPNESAWAGLAAGAVVTVALGPVAALAGTVTGVVTAYNLARNMIANEAIYEKLLATSPAGEDNFNRLMHLLKSLPIKSLKDD
jgi:hypothetical protein